MGVELKLTMLGKSLGVVLPKEILARLRLGEGDTVQLLDTPNGVELRPCRPTFVRQLDLAKEVMRENHDVLAHLAK